MKGVTSDGSLKTLLDSSPFKKKHVISIDQFNREDLKCLLAVAKEMKERVEQHGVLDFLKSSVLCTLFFEPSTRTSASFDAAMQRLGGRVIPIATQHSSTVKGESLEDTVRTIGAYADAIVLRHPDQSSASVAAKHSPVPIINGGNGNVEHPTQAFLDLFTINQEMGTVDDLTITFIGDLRNGRTVHSLIKILQFYKVKIQLIAPEIIELPRDVRDIVLQNHIIYEGEELTPEVIGRSDVLYCTRVQKERFRDIEEYERLRNCFVLNKAAMTHAKQNMIVMHPLPRNQEIDPEVDKLPQAAYFRQVRITF